MFLTLITQVFSRSYSPGDSWVIAGLWREAHEKLVSLITKQASLTPFQMKEVGINSFDFPFKTAYVSYQESIADKHATYYQQRYHATEVDDIKTLREFLFGNTEYKIVHKHYRLLEQFNLRHLLDEEVIKLSNGETRKATILRALLTNPQVLIMDAPYAGIDQKTIPELNSLFKELAKNGLSIILITNSELPDWISKVLLLNSLEETMVLTRDEFKRIKKQKQDSQIFPNDNKIPAVAHLTTGCIVKLNNVKVSYGKKVVLNDINWEIKSGEKWLLTGRNGAGKSTLLSLIYADHPQSYANDIELFGKKRGTGESVWDIKEKMALCSPEVFNYFDKTVTCRNAILSGIYFHPFKKGIKHAVLESFAQNLFLQFFNIEKLNHPLNSLSGVQQRLVLFLRALAQNTPLVLLDEPFLRFDNELTDKCKHLIEFCCRDKTLIFVSHHPDDVPGFVNKEFKLN